MLKQKFRVIDLLELDSKMNNQMDLKCIAGKNNLDRIIESKIINRPGLALGGYFNFFANNRIQVFGIGESMFIKDAKYEDELKNIALFFNYEIPCCIFSNNIFPSDLFIEQANIKGIPILVSELASSDLVDKLFEVLLNVFAETTVIHGVLVEVFGIGILIKGKSGIGKSETALELLQRGHRLIADDKIKIQKIGKDTLIGKGTSIISHHMEIRGVGIINIKDLFGVGGIRNEKKIQLITELEEWDSNKIYERLGDIEKYMEILNVPIHHLLIPIKPGRNIPIIIETAAMNQRLKLMGVNAAKEFELELVKEMERKDILKKFFTTK